MQMNSENPVKVSTVSDLLALSVVVIGRNEGQRLAKCLESIQQVKGVVVKEVIYVDSDSSDGSQELARRYGSTVIEVRPERPTAAIGRNAGWRHASSELILFLDGDTILNADFPLAACFSLSENPKVSAVWGHRREIHPEASLYNRVLDFDWVYAPGFTDFCGGDVIMRRSVLEQTGGFDDGLIAGEEPELCRRMRALNYSILHIDHPMTGHDLQITRWSQYWKRASRAGHAYAEVSERYRGTEDPAWEQDRKRNIIRGSLWIASVIIVIMTSFWYRLIPLLLWLALALLLILRTAWKARWKGKNPWSLMLYGAHSHFQQIPILIGQLQFELSKRTGKKQRLIEYKEI